MKNVVQKCSKISFYQKKKLSQKFFLKLVVYSIYIFTNRLSRKNLKIMIFKNQKFNLMGIAILFFRVRC